MTRKEFLRAASLLGLGLPFCGSLRASGKDRLSGATGKVIIIGGGAAGLSAGYLLGQAGMDYVILEASTTYGGRMQVNKSFADFPLALGAEWITRDTVNFNPLADTREVLSRIETTTYTQDDQMSVWHEGKRFTNYVANFHYKKFVNSSWMDFFETFVLPGVRDKLLYQAVVKSVNYAGDTALVKTSQDTYEGSHVIVTAPLAMLQKGNIRFSPVLPRRKLESIAETEVWAGFKAFFEFKEQFYPAFTDFVIVPETKGQISYYDAAYGQRSNKHILGLFAVGQPAEHYASLSSAALKDYVLAELDTIFDQKASAGYLRHLSKDWTKEPYIGAAYASDLADTAAIAQLQRPVKDRLYFAGDCYTPGYDWGNVHNAIASAALSVQAILETR